MRGAVELIFFVSVSTVIIGSIKMEVGQMSLLVWIAVVMGQ
jgi:hypothetical protein